MAHHDINLYINWQYMKVEEKRFCMQMIVHYEDLQDEALTFCNDMYEYYLVYDHCELAINFWQDTYERLFL